MSTLVVGYDASPAAEAALDRAAQIARAFSARLVVVTVRMPYVPAAAAAPMGGVLVPPIPLETMEEIDDESGVARWQELLATVKARLEAEGVDAVTTSAVGRPIDELVELADELDADMIVVGTHEPGLLERIFSGSVSQGVARRAHCDVLIVHTRRDEAAHAADAAGSAAPGLPRA